MSKGLALTFAVAGVLLLIAIAAALSYRNAPLAIAAALADVLLIGIGFMVKARMRRRHTQGPAAGSSDARNRDNAIIRDKPGEA